MAGAPTDDTLPIPRPAGPGEVLHAAARALAAGVPVVVATVVGRRGSAPSTPGQKLLLTGHGQCLGTVGGGALERAVLHAVSRALTEARTGVGTPRAETFSLGSALGMCCGGGVDVLIEPMPAARAVGIVGAGHVAAALAPLLAGLGFAVTVADPRAPWTDPSRWTDPRVRVLTGDFDDLGDVVPRDGALLVMSHDHQVDHEAVAWALSQGYAMVGGVGSRGKVARTRARLTARGHTPADVARVRMPIGMAIGARLPAEIAVSIAAELVAWRRGVSLPSGAVLTGPGATVPAEEATDSPQGAPTEAFTET